MHEKPFPRTTVAGISLPRMLIGTNWMLGWGHRTPSADRMITDRNRNKEAIADIICEFLRYDINAIMAPASGHPVVPTAANWRKTAPVKR